MGANASPSLPHYLRLWGGNWGFGVWAAPQAMEEQEASTRWVMVNGSSIVLVCTHRLWGSMKHLPWSLQPLTRASFCQEQPHTSFCTALWHMNRRERTACVPAIPYSVAVGEPPPAVPLGPYPPVPRYQHCPDVQCQTRRHDGRNRVPSTPPNPIPAPIHSPKSPGEERALRQEALFNRSDLLRATTEQFTRVEATGGAGGEGTQCPAVQDVL